MKNDEQKNCRNCLFDTANIAHRHRSQHTVDDRHNEEQLIAEHSLPVSRKCIDQRPTQYWRDDLGYGERDAPDAHIAGIVALRGQNIGHQRPIHALIGT